MEIQGIIKAKKKNNKAILIKEDWYNFFKEDKEFKKGDEVKLDYKLNKGFKNITKINLLFRKSESKLEPEPKEELEQPKNPKTKLELTTLNTILMCAKDIHVACINNNYVNEENSYKEIIKEILEGLKEI